MKLLDYVGFPNLMSYYSCAIPTCQVHILMFPNIFLVSVMYERFKKLLDERGCKTSQVCKETKIDPSTFSHWKAGDYEPKPQTIKKIADYFDVPISYFYSDEPSLDFIVEIEDEYPTYFEALRNKIPNDRVIHYEQVFSKMLDLSEQDRQTIEDLIDRLSNGDK